MSAPEPNDDERIREELVAYLDGELSNEEALAVESRLGADERYRRELQTLERAWNALDELPEVTVGEAFTKTTIEMAAAEAQQDVARMTAALPVRQRRRRLSLVLGAAAAALLAFVVARAAITSPDRQLARELPLVLHADALAQARDIDFLRMLSSEQVELVADFSGEQTQADADAWAKISDDATGERMQWVRDLSETDKARLLDASRRFHELPREERERLHNEYQDLASANDAERLRTTALAYYGWLSTQTPAVQSELRQIDANKKRLKRVASLWKQQMWRLRWSLSVEDARALRAALRSVADSEELTRTPELFVARLEEWRKEREREERGRWERRDKDDDDRRRGHGPRDRKRRDGERRGWDPRVMRHPALRVWQLQGLANASTDHHFFSQLFDEQWDEVRETAGEDWGVIEPQLTSGLSDRAQRILEPFSDRERGRHISFWVVNAAGDALTDADLDAFFASDLISDGERNEILALPAEEMKERLRQMYIERELGGLDPAQLEVPWRPRRRGGDGPDRGRGGRRDDGERDRDGERGERRRPTGPGPGPPFERRGPDRRGADRRGPAPSFGPDGPPPPPPEPGEGANDLFF